MWEPRRLTTLWASTACYGDSFTYYDGKGVVICSIGGRIGWLFRSVSPAYTYRTIFILQIVALDETYSLFAYLDRYRYANRLGDTASKIKGNHAEYLNTSSSVFKLKKIGTGKHQLLQLQQNIFRSANCCNSYSHFCKNTAQKLYLRIQSDSKLLSRFLRPIIFKQETTKQNGLRRNKGVHVEVV
jgi:hypothetical protein